MQIIIINLISKLMVKIIVWNIKKLFGKISEKLSEESNRDYLKMGQVYHTGYSYALEVEHTGLNSITTLKSKDSDVLTENINKLFEKWSEDWMEQAVKSFMNEFDKQEKNRQNNMLAILKNSVNKEVEINWNNYYDNNDYYVSSPKLQLKDIDGKPKISDKLYKLKNNMFTLLFKKLKQKERGWIKA